MVYSKEEREQRRIKFATKRAKGHSIEKSCAAAGISTSTYYAWNEDKAWSKDNGWSKDGGWTRG
jgi:DNA invertase Pin-like site-specific DNA recombinase